MRIWQETRKTILFVTHDLEEALEMGDRMLILGREGKVLDDIEIDLSRPRSLTDEEFVAFYAQCNRRFLSCRPHSQSSVLEQFLERLVTKTQRRCTRLANSRKKPWELLRGEASSMKKEHWHEP